MPKQICTSLRIAAQTACILHLPLASSRLYCALMSGLCLMATSAGIYSFALISLEPFFAKRDLPLNSPYSV